MGIEVSVPSSMIMLQNFPVETVVRSHLPAAVTMKASDGEALSQNHQECAFGYKCFHFHVLLFNSISCLQVPIIIDVMLFIYS